MAHSGTFTDTLRLLAAKGLSYGTVLDLGCADGHFFLQHQKIGCFVGAVPFNVDANSIYEPSLEAIKNVVGGGYAIAAVTDHVGEVELTLGSHPYWSSLLNESQPYWQRINRLHTGRIKVPAVTVDALVKRANLLPPFLLKLDIQGAELAALGGAPKTLEETDVVICEIDLADFRDLDRAMNEARFSLFDMTDLRRIADGSLGWFYPIYLNRRRDHIRSQAFWDSASDQTITDLQRQRREQVLDFNARVLADLRKA